MPSHLRKWRDLSYEQRQRALQYELSPGGAARLQRLGVSLPPLDEELLSLVPDYPATSGQGTLPAARLSGPEFGADRNSSSPFSAHSDPLNGSRRFDGYYCGSPRPGLPDRGPQRPVGDVCQSTQLPGHLHDEVFPQRGRRTQAMMQNLVGREETIRLSLNWNAREELAMMDAPTRPPDVTPNQVLPSAHHVAGSIPVLNHTNTGIPPPPPPPPPPPAGYGTNQSTIPSKLRGTIRFSTLRTRPNGLRIRTSTPLSRPATSPQFQPRLQEIGTDPGGTGEEPRVRRRSPKDGPVLHARRAVMGRIRRARQNRTPQHHHQTRNSLQPRIKSIFTAYLDNLSDASQRENYSRISKGIGI
ncbi:hypothetical protein H4Q26_002909 [Puccinia striiformis f. sp. tritici PST-130]|nr:hypothetical protein H4Q26_002909 [Puccinia striiformis f. sp. tritici PST-130]